ncbi:hypothetical protein Tco_0441569 [Tanacetum coccineum]
MFLFKFVASLFNLCMIDLDIKTWFWNLLPPRAVQKWESVFIMFSGDLGVFAYGSGDALMLHVVKGQFHV